MSSSSSSASCSKKTSCFNRDCKGIDQLASEQSKLKRGWRLRNGDFAQLCGRCAAAYDGGIYCEAFHLYAAGWRNCESCGKRIHCGCIVSIHAYILLDAGGVYCMSCARRNIFKVHNQIQPPYSQVRLPLPDRLQGLPVINCNQFAGLSATSGHWVQPINICNNLSAQCDLNPRVQYDIDGIKQIFGECSALIPPDRKLEDPSDTVNNRSLSVMDNTAHVNTTVAMVTGSHSLHSDDGSLNCLQGMMHKDHLDACFNNSLKSSSSKEDKLLPHFAAVPYPLPNEANDLHTASVSQPPQQTSSPTVKQCNAGFQNEMGSSEVIQKRIGRLPVDAHGQSPSLSRYWPKITDQEIQHIPGDSKSVVTPLFEKTLSASDAGRVGRLVLPKKCAEAYFPKITQSDGLPLKVQDEKGEEWALHFRFWPNNNSRMYVLEGITPCIQSMQLQAGDTVTFSRLDPEGTLIMGFRTAARILPSDQYKHSVKTEDNVSKNSEGNDVGPDGSWPIYDKSGYIAKDIVNPKSFISPKKRKSRSLDSKGKCLRIDNEDLVELKLRWEEAQGLHCVPPNHDPIAVVVEGHTFEEYEEAPILGNPTIIATDQIGEKIQWAQCEDCTKWRKVPIGAHLPSGWTCSANFWDQKRSSCRSAQEVTSKQLEDIVSSNKTACAIKKNKLASKYVNAAEAPEALSSSVNHNIPGEEDALPSTQTTTKHPRHRSGCTCIVCIQPRSGNKHKDTCICNVCVAVKRRKLSFMKRLSERDTESARKKLEQLQLPDNPELEDDLPVVMGSDLIQEMVNTNSDNNLDEKKRNAPPVDQIDLNVKPQREDVPSVRSCSSSMVRLLSGNHKLHPILQGPKSLSHEGNFVLNESDSTKVDGCGNDATVVLDSEVQHDASTWVGNKTTDTICVSKSASMPISS